MSGVCPPGTYRDTTLHDCPSCDDICHPKYGTLNQCAQNCMEYLARKAYKSDGAGDLVSTTTGLPGVSDGTTFTWPLVLGLLLVLFLAMAVAYVFGLFTQRRYNILGHCCQARLGGVPPEDPEERGKFTA